MANDTDIVFLEVQPLVTIDAGGLKDTVLSKSAFQPTMVLRTDPSVLLALSATALAAAGDTYRIMIATPSAMRDSVFYPISLNLSFAGEVAGTGFWETLALYSIVAPVGPNPLRHAWRSFDLDAIRTQFNGGTIVGYQTASPVFQGFPPSPVIAVETNVSAIGGFQFVVATFAAADKAAITVSIDARWLVFPRSASRNAGFYTQRMSYIPQ